MVTTLNSYTDLELVLYAAAKGELTDLECELMQRLEQTLLHLEDYEPIDSPATRYVEEAA